jgi:hypothetical protein
MKIVYSLTILFVFFSVTKANVWTYPNPGGATKESPFYELNISQGKVKKASFVYFSKATFADRSRSSSYSTFSFSGKVQVEVLLKTGQVNACIIRPKAKNIKFRIQDNRILFTLNKPAKLAIEINGDTKNPLFVFGDEPEENIPDKNSKVVLYFERGVHQIGTTIVPDSIRQIYLEGGAYVIGAFKINNKSDGFILNGRGIISAEMYKKIPDSQQKLIPDWGKKNPHNVEFTSKEGKNILVDGITFTDGPQYGLIVRQSNSVVRNCNFFGWNYNCDGVSTGDYGLVEDCFFRCNDDAVKVYPNYFVARKCVFWQNDNGAPFQISWNLKGNNHNFRVYDCDIVCCEHAKEANNRAIFNAIHAGEGNLSDYLFENIRIEGDVFRLFKLSIEENDFDYDPGFGSISNIRFKNITLEGKCLRPNQIYGYNEAHKVSCVSFENLKINGRKIKNAKQGNFIIDPLTTDNITFK